MRGVVAERLDATARTVTLADGESIEFDQALMATGSRNRDLEVPGVDLDERVRPADASPTPTGSARPPPTAGPPSASAWGSSAPRWRPRSARWTSTSRSSRSSRPRSGRCSGARPARSMARIHADHGVKMRFNDTVDTVRGRRRPWSGCARRWPTTSRPRSPSWGSAWSRTASSGRSPLTEDGGIPVDPTLQTEVPGIWAAGDVASHDHPVFGQLRVEHFDNAIKMGETAARNMLGAGRVHDDPHWFWSDQYDVAGPDGRGPAPDGTGRRARLVRGPVVLRVLARRRRRAPRRDVDRVAPGRPPRDRVGASASQARPGQARRPRVRPPSVRRSA